MLTSIVILTWNQLEYTKKCVESIRKYTDKNSYEIIIVDNHSTDGTVQWLKEQKDIHCIFNNKNNGFPGGCNQGIAVSKGDSVLLLNNDTIVTPNWLLNLRVALFSSENIGAVGAISNFALHQSIEVTYKSENINEMIEFAEKINISNPDLWEERLKLIGFCMLIKMEVIQKVGKLDELFSPGNYEDDDYSFRILEHGYKLLLCKDTFIHHYGSVTCKTIDSIKLCRINRGKFIDKWGFDTMVASEVNFNLLRLFQPTDDPISVLEIGCQCGGTLLGLKQKIKNSKLFGIEQNNNSAKIAQNFSSIFSLDINNSDINDSIEIFDSIIILDRLGELTDISVTINKMGKYLKSHGTIITTLDKIIQYDIMNNLINGGWVYKNTGLTTYPYYTDVISCHILPELVILYKKSQNSESNLNTSVSTVKYNLFSK